MRAKGGKYIINLGVVGNETIITDRIPKELIEIIKKGANGTYFNSHLLDTLKLFDISFIDEDKSIKASPLIRLSEDLLNLDLEISRIVISDTVNITTYQIDFSLDDGEVVVEFYKDSADL